VATVTVDGEESEQREKNQPAQATSSCFVHLGAMAKQKCEDAG
jgi:hypothetical protein